MNAPLVDFQLTDQINGEIARVFAAQQRKKLELRHSTAQQRLEKLWRIKAVIEANKPKIVQAAYDDYRKPELEVALGEIMPAVSAANFAIKHLRHWMKPQRVKKPMNMIGIRCELHYEPKGSSLIIAPWNYPVFLTFVPLVSAVAAGCTAILKPSEMTPHLSALIEEMVKETFDESEVRVFQGDASVATALLDQPFDHIFYTGNPQIGKVVMAAAAKNLTSVTLELGGKSPVIIDETADVEAAAQRIAWGKFLNCGQTCVAPDHVWIHESRKEELVSAVRNIVHNAYETDADSVRNSPHYSRIVNHRHFERINSLIEEAKSRGATVEVGGETDGEQNFIAPTLLSGVAKDARIMDEEIFGPVLPMLTYRDIEEVLDYVNGRPKPLALYVFSKVRGTVDRVLRATSSGGTAVNNVMIHGLSPYMPFGGVNNSGMGKSNGFFGFKEFSNEKAVAIQRSRFSALQMFAPPYTDRMKKTADMIIRRFA